MSPVNIPCPKCKSSLKLPNRSLLGRKGKCPKCQHRFVLEEPDEVELELAEPEPSRPQTPETPKVGTAAKWVPDQPGPISPAAQPGAPAVNAFDFSEPPADGTTNELDFAAAAPAEEKSVVSRVRNRKKKSKTGPIVVGVGTALFLFSMLGLWWQGSGPPAPEPVAESPKVNEEWEEEKAQLADSNQEAKKLSPTSGETIPMQFMPFTPHLICHMRPAEIWQADRQSQIFVATLSNLGVWLSDSIRDITRFEPQEIEEVTFAFNFGPRTSPPDIAAIVRLKSEQSASDMQLNRFQGRMRPDLPAEVFESERYSYMMIDSKTFVVAGVTLSDMLADAKKYSQQPAVELEGLLSESDRNRHITLAFDVLNIDTHREYIFAEEMQSFADEFVLWFGKDVQTVSWSMHLGENLFMETLVHESNTSSPLRVQRHLKLRMQELPESITKLARFMTPQIKGYRDMIGRLPAMLQATVLGTKTHIGPSYVRMVTLLPGKAAANLAAASIFTWNQSGITDFSGPSRPVATGPVMPDKIGDRLRQVKMLIDFRRTPLQEAFAYISEEIQTQINIDGEGLKMAAMTNNMAQTYNLGEATALEAIRAMAANPLLKGELVIVVDEGNKTITVTSRTDATAKGLPIYDLSK